MEAYLSQSFTISSMLFFIVAGLLWPAEVLIVMTFFEAPLSKYFWVPRHNPTVDLSDPHFNETVPDPERLPIYAAIVS
jgi:hypothetical protein